MTKISPEDKGFLTVRQRQYLAGEIEDLDTGDENALRGKIRNRIETAFAEFQLLEGGQIDRNERRLIWQSGYDERNGVSVEWPSGMEALTTGRWALPTGFLSLLGFFYKTQRENGKSEKYICEQIAMGIENAEQDYLEGHKQVEATVEIESVESVDIEDAKERFDEKGVSGVSTVELDALAESGYVEIVGPED